MSDHGAAELIGAHMALSTPAAIAWRRVIAGEISIEQAAALLGSPEDGQLARRVFAAPTPERLEQLLATLLTRLATKDEEDHDPAAGPVQRSTETDVVR